MLRQAARTAGRRLSRACAPPPSPGPGPRRHATSGPPFGAMEQGAGWWRGVGGGGRELRPAPVLVPSQARHFQSGREVQPYRHFKGGGGFFGGGIRVPSRGLTVAVGTVTVGAAAVYVTHLETVPISGRSHFVLMSHETERRLADAQYKQVLRGAFGPVCPPGHPAVAVVERVGGRIAREVGRMAAGPEQGSMGHLAGVQWRFTVVDSPEINAFVLPGGQVVVFSGLLRLLRSDRELAAVVGHEAAHVVARHSAEKVSWGQTLMLITVAVGALFGIGHGLLQPAVALGLELPFSRRMETEADAIGLQIMARACYDPNAAEVVFRKMARAKHGAPQLPAYLSTHPEDKDRIQKVREGLPEAIRSYDAKCGRRQGAFAAAISLGEEGILLR